MAIEDIFVSNGSRDFRNNDSNYLEKNIGKEYGRMT